MLPKKKVTPSPRACLPCRDKHLKCDGKLPICERCANASLPCTFVQSRRGHRGPTSVFPAAQPTSRLLSRSGLEQQQSLPEVLQLPGTDQQTNSWSEETISVPYIDTCTPDEHYLIGLYYRYIHPAHPFLLPKKLYNQNRDVFPKYLKQSICFIASHHSATGAEQYRDASNAVFGVDAADDAFKVQSLILVTLASYARFERDRGNQALNAAIDMAYRIGLNSNDYGRGYEPLYQESWRRTWWELYTITGLISLISGTNLRLSQPAQMTLPYECESYETCQQSYMGNGEEMQERFRAEAPTKWSSFAYRVEAMRILSTVLDVTNDASFSRSETAEASVSSYLLSLPTEKQDGLKDDGEVDEVMSCALMIIHLAGICLHLPRSTLAQLRGFKTICGNDRGQAASERPKIHQAAALRSAKALARLLTSHTTLSTLSPCFSCAIAFAATTQLSEYSTQPRPRSQYLSEILQLELSALASLGQIWPVARVVRSQIAAFARDVMSKSSGRTYVEPMPDLGPPLPDEGWLQDLISESMILE